MAHHSSEHDVMFGSLPSCSHMTERAQRSSRRYGAPTSIVDPLLSLLFDLHHLQDRVISELERIGVNRDEMPYPFGCAGTPADTADTRGENYSRRASYTCAAPTAAELAPSRASDVLSVYCQDTSTGNTCCSSSTCTYQSPSTPDNAILACARANDAEDVNTADGKLTHTGEAEVASPGTLVCTSIVDAAKRVGVVESVLHWLDTLSGAAKPTTDAVHPEPHSRQEADRDRALSAHILAQFIAAASDGDPKGCYVLIDRHKTCSTCPDDVHKRRGARSGRGRHKFQRCDDSTSGSQEKCVHDAVDCDDKNDTAHEEAAHHTGDDRCHNNPSHFGDRQASALSEQLRSCPDALHVGSFSEEDMRRMMLCWKEYEQKIGTILVKERRLLESVCSNSFAARPTLHAKYTHEGDGRSRDRLRRVHVPTCEGVTRNCIELVQYHDALAQCQAFVHAMYNKLSDAVDMYIDESEIVSREEDSFWRHVGQLECEYRALHEMRHRIKRLRRMTKRYIS